MEDGESSQGWANCFQLLVMPWRLSANTFKVGALAACLSGALAVWWMSGSFLTFVYVGADEPWGYWRGVWGDFIEYVGPCFIAALFVPMIFASAYALLHWINKRKYRVVVIGLSPVCIVLPYTIWIFSVALVEFSGDIMVTRNILNTLGELWVFKIAGSCFWLPAFFSGLLVHTVVSIKQADQAARLYYRIHICSCNYDLRGSIAGGATACPECGADIPEWMHDEPPSLITRPAHEE